MPARIAVLGAHGTGKTRLCEDLAGHLRARGHRVAVVPEPLPCADEALALAKQHERRIDEAERAADLVIADTTALQMAAWAPLSPLNVFAQERQHGYALTLLMGLDLPDGRDLPPQDRPAREQMDTRLRDALTAAGLGWRVIYGQGPERARQALDAVGAVLPWAWEAAACVQDIGRWARLRAQCEKCGDASCEHRVLAGAFRRLTAPPT